MFAKKPDPHDEAMEILKDQMANPPQPVWYPISAPITHTQIKHNNKTKIISDLDNFMCQSQKKPQSFHLKEEGGLKASKTIKSRLAGPSSSNISPAPPPGELFTHKVNPQ